MRRLLSESLGLKGNLIESRDEAVAILIARGFHAQHWDSYAPGAFAVASEAVEIGDAVGRAGITAFQDAPSSEPPRKLVRRSMAAVDTDRKKRANFDREDGATRHVSGAHYGTGAHSGRSQREVIFCVE